jgi:hypothetical protein
LKLRGTLTDRNEQPNKRYRGVDDNGMQQDLQDGNKREGDKEVLMDSVLRFVFLNETMKTKKKEGAKVLPDILFLSPARLVRDRER